MPCDTAVQNRHLETMHLDGLLVDLKGLGEEVHHLLALITLELENLAVLLVTVDVTVATEVLLQRLENSLEIILAGHALHGRDGLTTVTLLASDVDVVDGLSVVVTCIGEGI